MQVKVHVLTSGIYDGAETEGVYATPEAAFAAWPKGQWHERIPGSWSNYAPGISGDDEASVDEYEVVGT